MKCEFIEVKKEKGIATVALNRPDKRNAMHPDMVAELKQAFSALAEDNAIHVLLLCGRGEHFCAGADIAHMKAMAECSYEENFDDAQQLADLIYQIYDFPKPVIGLAHGATLGGGLGLLAACDIALAARDASFGFSEVKIGITPSTISPYVISAIGQRAARYYFLTGVRFGAEEAAKIGLIHQVTDDDALYRTGHALATTMLLNSPSAMNAAKHLINHIAYHNVTPELAQKTAEHLANIRTSKQAKEGLQAFLEKRTPIWS